MGDVEQPLAGVTVLELATGVAGPYAGKLMADYGADVVKVEPPGGDPARHESPEPGERPDPERSPLFLHLNTNKRSVVAGHDAVRSLAAGADIVIESGPPGEHAWLREVRPGSVVVSVTPFGRSGPYSSHSGAEIVSYAMGGPMHVTGMAGRAPLKLAGNVVQYQCGGMAATAALAGLALVERSGESVHIDVSNFRTQAGSIDRRAALLLLREFTGRIGRREGGHRLSIIPAGIYPTLDGYVQVLAAPNWMPRLVDMLGDEELSRRVAEPDWTDDPEFPELLDTALHLWTLQLTKQGAMIEAQGLHLGVTPVNSTADLLADDHFRARDFWQPVHHPVVGDYEAPGAPFRMRHGWALRRPAPTLGQHTDAVLADPPVRRPPAEPTGDGRLPLEGIRVLDLTVVWAGPYCTMLLGDLGAQVIKVDNAHHFPTASRGAIPRPVAGREAELGQYWSGFPGGDSGDRPWNRVAAFLCHARGKLGATLDLRTPSGHDAFMRLVDNSDVVVENNSAKVMDRLGLGWDALHERNPRLIVTRMPSLGLTGPYRDYIGFGAHVEALCGLTGLRGYPDLDPTATDSTYHMDPASGTTAAFAVLAALRRRERTGEGELIEFAQAENLVQHIGEFLVDTSMSGETRTTLGNRHPHRAPQGAYPCAGDDRWIVISVADDGAWAGLRRAMGDPQWAADPRFDTEAGRRDHHDEIDAHLAGWTAGLDRHDAFARCQAEGVAAGPVLDDADCYADPQLRAEGFFRTNSSADVPEHEFTGHLWTWDGPELAWGPLSRLGADNEYVMKVAAGLTDEEYRALEEAGHFSLDYLDPEGRPL